MADFSFGYCTNVHAGITLEQAKDNLLSVAAQVRQHVAPEGRLPVGLWLAENAAGQLHAAGQAKEFANWLNQQGLKAYTFNGFPQGDFHQPVVKHEVYVPTWLESSRLEYTQVLATILADLLDDGQNGSISTLPLGWPHKHWQPAEYHRAAELLQRMAEHLDRLYHQSGHEIVLAIEPEPGCVIDTAVGMTEFLSQYVFDDRRSYIRRHIGVCHDVCHSAVMFEAQHAALTLYRQAGIRIGKVQVSSAVQVPWSLYQAEAAACKKTREQLTAFNEPKYLHQTTRLSTADQQLEMVDDLGLAISHWLTESAWPAQDWRIHFHVPIYVSQFGQLKSTHSDIDEVVAYMNQHKHATIDGADWFTGDYEVETYAWGVLPAELRVPALADGIANELKYFETVLSRYTAS